MPYIRQKDRDHIDAKLEKLVVVTPGELNYAVTRLVLNYLKTQEQCAGKLGYQDINDALGALEGAKLEFYRRYAARYEDCKKAENGDVY
jgi:hypothetical protein